YDAETAGTGVGHLVANRTRLEISDCNIGEGLGHLMPPRCQNPANRQIARVTPGLRRGYTIACLAASPLVRDKPGQYARNADAVGISQALVSGFVRPCHGCSETIARQQRLDVIPLEDAVALADHAAIRHESDAAGRESSGIRAHVLPQVSRTIPAYSRDLGSAPSAAPPLHTS